MKRKILLVGLMMISAVTYSNAQDTIAGWTFPSGTNSDANPDIHNSNNALMALTTGGGTSAIQWNKYGVETYAAQATGWNSGANLKYWQIEVNTTGFNNLMLSSLQTAGGANAGPRDWKAQYKVGSSGTWTDIPGTTLIAANDWTSAVIDKISIPSDCNNQPSVFIRWIMTSDTSIAAPALVQSSGTTKIDSIFIFGTQISTSIYEKQNNITVDIYPNPAFDFITVKSDYGFEQIEIFNSKGVLIRRIVDCQGSVKIDVAGFIKGVYFVKTTTKNNVRTSVTKFVVM